MKLAIVGGRDFTNKQLMGSHIAMIMAYNQRGVLEIPEVKIISGGAEGADTLGEEFARIYEVPITIFKPDWEMFGKSAGFIRNQQIVDACDMVLAFWNGKSKGTKDTINKARIAKKPTFTVYY